MVTRLGGNVDVEDIKAQLITVAVTSADAEKIAFGRDLGKVWLTLQNSDTDGRRHRADHDQGHQMTRALILGGSAEFVARVNVLPGTQVVALSTSTRSRTSDST